MYKFFPYLTNDYSVGLYNIENNDIYHSAFGALTEAYEKFVQPIDVKRLLKGNRVIKVLDICYGSGYNTKAFIETVYDSKHENCSIEIECVDLDKELLLLSPFLSSYVNSFKRFFYKSVLNKNIDLYDPLKKILSKYKKLKSNYTISSKTNIILLKNLISNYGIDFLDNRLKNYITEKDNSLFFDQNLVRFYDFLVKNDIHSIQNKNKLAFVHNIYYKNISWRDNIKVFYCQNTPFKLNFIHNDIRKFITESASMYDIVFLDGFTPAKCPCIWSVDLFSELYKHMNTDALLVTYNTSAPVRNALLSAGLYVGKTLDKNNNEIGTIASKNKFNIKYKLSEKQLGLLNTKAGIPYRDKNLILDNDTILSNRENEVAGSDLSSSSKFLKEWEVANEK